MISPQEFVTDFLKNAPPIAPIALSYFYECNQVIAKQWLIKGVMAKGETSSWIGPPGAGKSALITDLVICRASRTDWRGYRTKEQAGWVYFAFERADLVRRRLLYDAEPMGLTIEQWNQKTRDAGIGVKRKADLYDVRSALEAKKLVSQYNGSWHVAA